MPRWSLLLPAALLAACGPLSPPPAETRLDLPQAWRFADGQAPLDNGWWQGFGDAALSAVVTEALAHNTDVGLAAERVALARAQQRGAQANRGVEISFQNVGGYTRMPGVPATSFAFTTPELTISYDLDLFGRLREADRAARSSVLSSDASREAVRLGVASTAAATYINLLGLDDRLAILQENLDLRAQFLRLAKRRADTGYTSQLEWRQAQAEYDSNAALVPSTRLAISQTEDALSILIGRPPQAIARAGNGLASLRTPAVPGGLPSDLLTRRPDVYAAEQALDAANHSLRSARANRLPSFALTGSVSGSVSQILPQAQLEYLLSSIILAPLFDSGRREATEDAARAQRDQAAYAYKGTVLAALRDVNDALVAIARDREQIDLYQRQVESQAASLRLARSRYFAGYAPYFDQLDAERQLLLAQLNLSQARNALLTAHTSLFMALGGGWRSDSLQAAR